MHNRDLGRHDYQDVCPQARNHGLGHRGCRGVSLTVRSHGLHHHRQVPPGDRQSALWGGLWDGPGLGLPRCLAGRDARQSVFAPAGGLPDHHSAVHARSGNALLYGGSRHPGRCPREAAAPQAAKPRGVKKKRRTRRLPPVRNGGKLAGENTDYS